MDLRLVVLGVGLLTVSAGFTLYSLYMGVGSLAGASLSMSILGAVILVIGYTYRDPLSNTLQRYSDAASMLLVKIYEDLGLLSSEVIEACRTSEGVLVVYSKNPIQCSEARPGLGLAGSTPYIALLVKEAQPETGDPEQAISELGLAGSTIVHSGEGRIVVELASVRRELTAGGWMPLNPIQVLVPAYLALTLGKNIVLEREEFGEGVYRGFFRVVES